MIKTLSTAFNSRKNEERNIPPYSSYERTQMDRYSKESDVESSSDEDICVLLQALEVDRKEINATCSTRTAKSSCRSTMDKMRAPEKEWRDDYGQRMPQGHQYDTYKPQGKGRVSRPGYQLPRTPGYSENEASVGPQQCQWNSAFRRPVYSYQQADRSCSGCPVHEADARANQLPGNGRVRRSGVSYRLAKSPGYSENEASAEPQQYQWNSAFRRPVHSYQQADRCCSGCPDHEADARANQLPGNGRVRRSGVSYRPAKSPEYSENGACAGPRADKLPENGRVRRLTRLYQQASSPGYSNHGANARAYHHQQPDSRTYVRSTQQSSSRGYLNQQAKVRGYSNNLANDRDQHQAHHMVQDRRVIRSCSQITRMSISIQQSTQRNEMAQPRRGMEWSHKGARLPPIQKRTRIQQHSQTQGLVAERRCGRQEFCEEPNRGPAKRVGVCHETDHSQRERVFLRVLAKRF